MLVRFTGKQWIDPVVALMVAIYIAGIGIALMRHSAGGLMDRQDKSDNELLQRILDAHVGTSGREPHICSYHKLRHRHSGRYHWVDFHIMVPPDWDIRRGHEVASAIEYEIEQALGEGNATAHIEPCKHTGCESCAAFGTAHRRADSRFLFAGRGHFSDHVPSHPVDAPISPAKIPVVKHDSPSQKRFRVGIVGVSGYGGGEALRLVPHILHSIWSTSPAKAARPEPRRAFPGIGRLGSLTIQKWDPHGIGELDLLFASLPSGESKEALAKVRPETRIVDIGGDHRYADGWTYGLADVWPEQIRGKTRVANPGLLPVGHAPRLAPLMANKLIDPTGIIIDAKSGVSGAGRGGGSTFGYAEVNEDVSAYGLFKHAHVPEMTKTLSKLAGGTASLTFTPHLIPMTRGILATCYAHGKATTAECLAAARKFYEGRPFVRVVEKAAAHQVGDGIESGLRFVCRRSRARHGHRAGRDRQPRQRRRRAGGAECESDARD